MKIIGMVSTRSGIGKTTAVVNIAVGLVNEGYKVLIVNPETKAPLLFNMLNIKSNVYQQHNVYPSPQGVDVLTGDYSLPLLQKLDYDYIFIDTGNSESFFSVVNTAQKLVALTDLSSSEEPLLLQKLDLEITNISRQKKCINMIIPSRIKTGEWENNSHILFLLTDHFAPEKIAALVPE